MSKCIHCPIKGDSPCLGDTDSERFGFFCDWAKEGSPNQLAHIVNRSAITSSVRIEEPIAGSDEVNPPSFFRKAANLSKAIVEHAGAGFPTTDRETIDKRWAICRTCEHFDAERTICRVCGCQLQVKIDWAEQKCPVGKW